MPKPGSAVLFWKLGRTAILTHVALHEQDDLPCNARNYHLRFELQRVSRGRVHGTQSTIHLWPRRATQVDHHPGPVNVNRDQARSDLLLLLRFPGIMRPGVDDSRPWDWYWLPRFRSPFKSVWRIFFLFLEPPPPPINTAIN